MFPVIAIWGHRCGLHITATTAIYSQSVFPSSLRAAPTLTPLAVRIGLALSLGSKAFLYSSGMALMMSTNLGTPPYEYFLLIFRRISFNETLWLSSWALMSSAAIPDVTRRRVSAWDGPTFPGMSDQQGYNV